jgi:hypothetical protein
MARFKSDKFLKNIVSGHIFTYAPEKEGLPDMVLCDLKGNPIASAPKTLDVGPETPEEAFEQATPAPRPAKRSPVSRLAALPKE